MKYIAFVLFVVSSLFVHAQDFTKLDSKVPVSPDVTIGKLDNGLTYYIQHNKRPEKKVELRLVVNAGSILETEKQRGLAHFMEHMNFNGTKNFQHNELVDYLQSIGVKFGQHLNAYTSFDETVYILPIPSDDSAKLEKGFDILEDWAFNNLLTPEEIDKERGVVLEELRLGLGADKRMMDKYLPLLMYKSHYAERLPIGLKSVLETFEHDELKDFYKQWYRPNLMSVIVVGDIDVAEMEQKIKDHFGSYSNPKNYKMRQEYFVPDHDETFVAVEHDKEASFSQVQLIYKDKGNPKKGNTVEDYRKGLVKALFNNMINDRLREIANNPNPPYNYGYSFHGSGFTRNKESYQSFAMTDPANQLRAFETLVVENERVLRFGFLESELERAKVKLKSVFNQQYKDRDKTESGRIVWEYVNHFLEGEQIPGIEWEYQAYTALSEGITLDEINALIKKFIHDDNRVVIFTSPENEENKYASKEEILNILKNVKEQKLEPYSEGVTAKTLMTNTPVMGSIKSTEKIESLDMTKLVLSNGITVYYKKTDFKDNEILMKAYSPGGSSLITSHDEYNSVKLAISGITQGGLNGFSKNDMAKVMAGKRASVTPFVGSMNEGFNGRTVNSDVEEMFQLIYLNFTALNKDKEAYKAFVDKQVAFYGNLLNTPQYWYLNEKVKATSKNNPRFTNTFPTADEYATQDYDKAYTLFTERFKNAGDFTFIFVGSIDEQQLLQMCMEYLAGLPTTGESETFVKHDFKKLEGKQELNFYRGEDPKSQVEISYRTEAEYTPQQAYYLKCAGEILTIKLVENLREGESGVYGVGASGYAGKYPKGEYYFRISFPCGPENVGKLKKAALEELDKLLANGPDQKELNKIKEAQKLELQEKLKSNRYWLNQVYNSIYYNEPMDNILNTESEIDAVTAEQIQEAMKKYIGENVVISVLYPEKK